MTIENANTPRETSPLAEYLPENTLTVRSDLKDLFNTLTGDELLEAVIERLQQYAIEELHEEARANFRQYKRLHMLGTIRETISEELTGWISHFISDAHREFIVHCHARGLPTAEAVWTLVQEDKPLSRLAQPDVMGTSTLQRALVTRLAYLKPGTARWPEKKYGALWREAREQHKQDIRDAPLTSPMEQSALLAKHADHINELLYEKNHDVKDVQALTDSLIKTVEALQKLSAVEQQAPPNDSRTQLVAVLERLTLALDTPEQFALGSDTEPLLEVLERLTLALKPSDPKAITDQIESVPTDTDQDNPT
ncbi:hypothetical protein J5I95_15800 [Candidatus Poribacteria bacterium]|nr:hypothetical protein [Candidatus Poribacteria bacterium]